ncbi:MAG: Lrp/AsnC family transcriptional regulator [Sphingomonadales bacterium]|nr:Lrp/AsnC family transcriptional regulator [Sphingomonadales bacterium]
MGSKRRLDSVDRQIIAMLARAPQTSNRDIAAQLGVAESTISVRVDALIRDKVIKLSVQQNIVKAGYGVLGWIDVSCAFADAERIAGEISSIETVFSISLFFENPFLQVMVFARSAADLRELVEKRIGIIPGVDAIAADVSIGEACIKQGIASL